MMSADPFCLDQGLEAKLIGKTVPGLIAAHSRYWGVLIVHGMGGQKNLNISQNSEISQLDIAVSACETSRGPGVL